MSLIIEALNKIPNFKKELYDVFIETGFFDGTSYLKLKNNFYLEHCKKSYSIELSTYHFNDGIKNYSFFNDESKKHNLVFGDSGIELNKILLNHQDDKVLFYFDAHFSSGNTAKSENFGECPIIGELNSIKILNKKPIIIIDDISIFIDTNHAGHIREEWPTLEELIEMLNKSKFDFKFIIDSKETNKLICY